MAPGWNGSVPSNETYVDGPSAGFSHLSFSFGSSPSSETGGGKLSVRDRGDSDRRTRLNVVILIADVRMKMLYVR